MSFSIIAAEGTEEKFAWIARYIKGKERVIVYSDKNKELAEYLESMGISCIDVNTVNCDQENKFFNSSIKVLAFYGKTHSTTNDNVFDHAEHIIIAFMQSSVEKLNDKINENAECTLLLSKEKIFEKCSEDTIKVNNLLYNSKILTIYPDDCFSEYYMKAEQYFQSKTFKIKERKLWPGQSKRKMEFPFMEGIALSKNNSLGYGRQIENDLREKNLSENLLEYIIEQAGHFVKEHDIKWITYITEPQNRNETEFMIKIMNHIGNKLDLPVRETLSISPYDENTIPADSEEVCADLMNRYSLISGNCIADDVLVVSFFAENTYKFSVFSALLNTLYEGVKVYPFSLIEEKEAYCSFTDNMYEFRKLLEITERRKITCFTHFTQIANLDSILDNGILSVYDLNHGNFEHRSSDKDRMDNHLEEISVSVSYPNSQMLYSKIRNLGGEWVVMELDPYFVLKRKCNFFKTNAASNFVKEIRQQRENNLSAYFEEMFAEKTDGERTQNKLPENFTTDEQAEIMVYRHIPVYAIKAVHFQNEKSIDRYSKKLKDLGIKYDSSDYFFHARKYVLNNRR